MNNTPQDGGPAFPVVEMHHGNAIKQACENQGMTLRDYFAAAALQHIPELLHANLVNKSCENIAEWSYQVADAMLAARNGRESQP